MNDVEFFTELLEHREVLSMLQTLRAHGYNITLGYSSPRDIRQFVEEVLLAPPDGIKCLTCYGKGKRPASSGRFTKCLICNGLGRREPREVPKW